LYTKDNILITITGKIQDQALLEKHIESLFSSLSAQKTRSKPEFRWQLPEKKSDFFVKGTEQNHLIIAMPGFTAFEEERYASRVLTTILGGNMSSRLFQEIREKLGLCYYIGAGHRAGFEY
jgi:Predicted Zn-dependent peptidases